MAEGSSINKPLKEGSWNIRKEVNAVSTNKSKHETE